MARAPQAIRSAQDTIVGGVGGAVASGIVGDASHTYGYHRAAAEIPASDYSRLLPADQTGPPDAASALDISLPPAQMIAVTARLRAAADRNDPRLYALREFAGTLNGTVTFNRDLSNGAEGYGQWDDSHLWHLHLSGYRRYADDAAAWRAIADVFTDSADLGGSLSEEDDMPYSEAELRKFINEEVGKALVASGTAGAGDWSIGQYANQDYTVGAKASKIVSDETNKVLRSEGITGGIAALLARPAGAGGSVMDPAVQAKLIADLLDDDLAKSVADLLSKRLAA